MCNINKVQIFSAGHKILKYLYLELTTQLSQNTWTLSGHIEVKKYLISKDSSKFSNLLSTIKNIENILWVEQI